MDSLTTDDTPIHTGDRLAFLQSKVVAYMISMHLRQLCADILIAPDVCAEDEICWLVDDEPDPPPIDSLASGIGTNQICEVFLIEYS